MITTVCKISYGSQTVPPIVPAVQGDTGRAISFEIADFTPPAGATATYFILKPSGEAIYNSATITDNSILCELTAQSLAEAGENRMQVRVLQGEDIVTSFEVILMVRTFLGDDAIQSGTEMNIFDQAVEQATEQFQENAEQIVEEVIESIPSDYTALTEEVDELNERIDNEISDLEDDIFEPASHGGYAHKTVTELFTDGSLTTAVAYPPGETHIGIITDPDYNSWYVKFTESADIFFDSSLNIGTFLIGQISNVTEIQQSGPRDLVFIGTDPIRYKYTNGEGFPTESNKLHVNANDTIIISLAVSVSPDNVTIYYGDNQSERPARTVLVENIKLNNSQMKQILVGLDYKEELPFVYGYMIRIADYEIGDVVDLTLLPYGLNKIAIVECKENDHFLLTIHGGGTSRAWSFVDDDNRLLSCAEAGAVLTNELVVVPQNAARIIVCDIYRDSTDDTTSTGGTAYRLVSSSSVLNSRLCYIATDYGISTGSTNNTPALQTLVDTVADNGGGVIYFPNGTYQFQRAAGKYTITMQSNVSIIGENSTKTILKQVGASSSMFYKIATSSDPIIGCAFKNFTVDAYETAYETGVQPWETSGKAFLFQYVENCVFEDLILKGTLATALGIDYLSEVKINNVTVIDGGRVYDGTQEGTSGIGIGTGGWDEENFTITDCVCVGCGQYGIFIENQHVMGWGGSTDTSKGQIISNCIIHDGLNNGLGIRSGSNVIVTDCLIYGNAKHGINIDKNIDTVAISDCVIRDNSQNGITIVPDMASENMNITNCVISGNENNGIYISPTANFADLQIKGNTIIENVGNGIECASPMQFLVLIGNYTKGNSIGLYISANSFSELIVKYNVFYDYFCNKNTGSDSHFNDIYGDAGDTTATPKGEIIN